MLVIVAIFSPQTMAAWEITGQFHSILWIWVYGCSFPGEAAVFISCCIGPAIEQENG